MEALPDVVERISDFITAQLRDEYPYLKTEVVQEIAQGFEASASRRIKAEESVIESTKARISFMSLSPELRNRVYEFAVVPEPDGRFREDGEEHGRDEEGRIFIRPQGSLYSVTPEGGLRCALKTPWSTCSQQPAITRLSKQIRAESLPVYYGANTFVLDPGYDRDEFPLRYGTFSRAASHRLTAGQQEMDELKTLVESEGLALPLMRTGMKWLEAIGKDNASLVKHIIVRPVHGFFGPEHQGKVHGVICDRIRKFGIKVGVDAGVKIQLQERSFGVFHDVVQVS